MESKIILIVGLLFFAVRFYAQKREEDKTERKINKLTGKEIVQELNRLNFFNLTDKNDLKITRNEFEKSYDKLNFFEGQMREDLSFTDNRFYFIDSETLFEGEGLIQYLETVQVLFDKINLKLVISEEFESQTEKHLLHKIKLNGKEYIAFDNDFGNYDWTIAYLYFVEMLNDQLKIQGSDEQFYPISSGNDGKIVLLTRDQFHFVKKHYPNDKEHPKEIAEWKEEFGY
ncbi:hypothetical protein [Flavobacterium nitrogenifigens]|uniref:Uncharacterized protein n=1 Tax=Flavobacterium nitrogenifigens TaxID=1617283 RepID=A0A521F325_9FLAO|nr:hypothetical protein [Flavobacterium nitrogenifigens]KAF2339666.1 hypothetical protein DM397_01105 [Flavobacterium nitrogenifigens]SMO90466.1 hypothetical protein SAMN06265220_10617 [Flavobacterium nitrogenifigens]